MSFGYFQNDVAPKHHPFAARRSFAMNLFEEIQVNAALTFLSRRVFAPTRRPRSNVLIATNVEEAAPEVRQQFVVELAQEGQGAGKIRRECVG